MAIPPDIAQVAETQNFFLRFSRDSLLLLTHLTQKLQT